MPGRWRCFCDALRMGIAPKALTSQDVAAAAGHLGVFLQHFLPLIFLCLFFITTGLKLLNLNVIHDFSVPFVKFRGGKADSLPLILTRYAEFPSKTSWSTHGLKGTTQNKL